MKFIPSVLSILLLTDTAIIMTKNKNGVSATSNNIFDDTISTSDVSNKTEVAVLCTVDDAVVSNDVFYDFKKLENFVVSVPTSELEYLQNDPNILSIEEDHPRSLIPNTNEEDVQQDLLQPVWLCMLGISILGCIHATTLILSCSTNTTPQLVSFVIAYVSCLVLGRIPDLTAAKLVRTSHIHIMNKRANNIMDDPSSLLPLLLSKHHQLNENDIGYLSLLLTIIESKNWIVLRCLIYSSPATIQQFARKVVRDCGTSL
jgi:hypothetical protein